MSDKVLSDVAKAVKAKLVKTPRTAKEIADKLERSTAKGLGPVLKLLVAEGHAVASTHESGKLAYSVKPKGE